MTICTNNNHGRFGGPCACAGIEIRRVVTVPRGQDAATQAIEKSGLVNIQSAGIVEVTGLIYGYAIIGYEPSDDLNRLDVTLTADQYRLLQITLRRAQTDPTRTSVHNLEIERLITIFAEAAAPDRKDTT